MWDASNYVMEEKQDVDSPVKFSQALTSQFRLMKTYLVDILRADGRFPAGHLTSVY